MSQKSSSSPHDYDVYGTRPSEEPAADERGQVYGEPTVRASDEVGGDPTLPTTPRLPIAQADGDSTLVKSGPPAQLPHEPVASNPDTPAAPGVPYYSPYPLPSGSYYEPYANAYAPPPPPPDPTLRAANPYDAYSPTLRSEYPPLPEMPARPARPRRLFHNKRTGKLLLAALLALLLIGASVLFVGVRYSNQMSSTSAAQQTAIAATYPFSNRLILKDPLVGNNEAAYGWDNNGQSCYFANSAYHDAYNQPGYYKPCTAANTSFNNFTFQAQMMIKQGDQNVGGGLIFRADTSAYKFYRLFITSRGYYQLRVYVDRLGSHSRLLRDGVAPPFHTGLGQTNKIAVSVNNDQLAFYVNKQLVSSASDDTFSRGQIGFNVDNPSSQNAEVIFTNARVWQL
ncbi:MAG TPA: hypothetical protein VF458_21235 [Ktedonobacteraceae bacterium]